MLIIGITGINLFADKKETFKRKQVVAVNKKSKNVRNQRKKEPPNTKKAAAIPSADITIDLVDGGMGWPKFNYLEERMSKPSEIQALFENRGEEGIFITSTGMQSIEKMNHMTPLGPKYKRGKDFRIALNNKMYVLEGNTVTVFYGMVKPANARYISIKFSDGSIITGEISNKLFLVGSSIKMEPDPLKWRIFKSIKPFKI